MQSCQERYDDTVAHVIPFLDRVVGLERKRVLEFGAGAGTISRALAPHVDSVLGLDIAVGDVETGQRLLGEHSIGNVELRAGTFDALLERCAERAGEVDLFLLFAVLEHMTIDERLAVLATARDVLGPGGSIAVFESPNRLLWWDHHSSQLPFFGMLEPSLALSYADRSAREDFTTRMRDAGDDAPLALARYGRGVSQHEFELVFGPMGRQDRCWGLRARAVPDPPRAPRGALPRALLRHAAAAGLVGLLPLLARSRTALRRRPCAARDPVAVRDRSELRRRVHAMGDAPLLRAGGMARATVRRRRRVASRRGGRTRHAHTNRLRGGAGSRRRAGIVEPHPVRGPGTRPCHSTAYIRRRGSARPWARS